MSITWKPLNMGRQVIKKKTFTVFDNLDGLELIHVSTNDIIVDLYESLDDYALYTTDDFIVCVNDIDFNGLSAPINPIHFDWEYHPDYGYLEINFYHDTLKRNEYDSQITIYVIKGCKIETLY